MVRKPRIARSMCLFVALLAGAGNCLAQFWGAINPLGESGAGFRLYGVQGSASYISNGLPLGYSQPSSQGGDYDISYGASASGGYSHTGTLSSFSVAYSVNYSGRAQYTQFNAWNHSFTLSGRRKIGRRWSGTLSANAGLLSSSALLFAPTSTSSLAAAPATFDELAAAVLAGNYSNAALASILTAAPMPEPAAQLQFYGYRSLATALAASISYAHSSRLSISANIGAGRSQHLSSSADNSTSGTPAYIVPAATTVTSSLSVSYSLSPRTQISVTGSAGRVISSLADQYTAQGTGSIGRTMGRRWFLQASVGSGYVFGLKGIAASSGTGYVVGGSVGYKTFAHTFVASYSRILGNNYGAGGLSSEGASGTWHWARPGASWSTSVSGSWQHASDFLFSALESWSLSAGLSRRLNSQTSASLQYAYLNAQIPTVLQTYKLNGVSLILSWSPSRRASMNTGQGTDTGQGTNTGQGNP